MENICNNTLHDITTNNPTEAAKRFLEQSDDLKLKNCHKEIILDCYGEIVLRKVR